jgi:hypothetical protein
MRTETWAARWELFLRIGWIASRVSLALVLLLGLVVMVAFFVSGPPIDSNLAPSKSKPIPAADALRHIDSR